MKGQAALRVKAGAVIFEALVFAGAKQEHIGGFEAGAVKILVKAPPVEGKANRAVVALLAERLGVPKGRVKLVQGTRSRRKVVAVSGLTPADVASKLQSQESP